MHVRLLALHSDPATDKCSTLLLFLNLCALPTDCVCMYASGCVFMWVYACAHSCGDQRATSDTVSLEPSWFFLKPSLPFVWNSAIGQASWSESSRDLLVTTSLMLEL